MATSIYQCDHCHFAFERAGEVENCPDCQITFYIKKKTEQSQVYCSVFFRDGSLFYANVDIVIVG